jgi:hypothetical protein
LVKVGNLKAVQSVEDLPVHLQQKGTALPESYSLVCDSLMTLVD